jgi:hypothetical protein
MGKLIAAQHRRYDPKFLGGETKELKPSNLYQEYLKKSGMLSNGNKRNGKIKKIIMKMKGGSI